MLVRRQAYLEALSVLAWVLLQAISIKTGGRTFMYVMIILKGTIYTLIIRTERLLKTWKMKFKV